VIIIVVAFLLFGANKLSEMGWSADKAISEFRKGAKEMIDGFCEEEKQTGATQTAPTPDVSVVSQTSFAASSGGYCIQCGTPNKAEARFCSSCGTKLPEKTA